MDKNSKDKNNMDKRSMEEACMGGKRINMALLATNLKDDFSKAICEGAMKMAEKLDINLLIIPGKYIERTDIVDEPQVFEYQYNTLFTYANDEQIDIVIANIGSIGYAAPYEKRIEFLKLFGDIPVLTIATKDAGENYIVYDNVTGLREGIEYLIHTQKKQRIGMISGPMDNEDSCQRLSVFRQVLKENQIALEESYITYGDCCRYREEPVEQLLRQHPDIEAIVCINDDTALAVYRVLKRRGIRIGEDILVIGFDDVEYARNLNPPLSTVRADAVEQGELAVEEAAHIVTKGHMIRHEVVTKFIPRESAGYKEPHKTAAKEPDIQAFYSDELYEYKAKMHDVNHITSYVMKNMMTFQNSENNYSLILKNLPRMEIEEAYLYIYREPIVNFRTWDFNKPTRLRLCAVLHGGECKDIPEEEQLIKSGEMFRRGLSDDRRHSFMLMNLYSNETLFGIMMYELKYDYFPYEELLTGQVGAAVRMMHLLQENNKVQKEINQMMKSLEESNHKLDYISRIDELTGIFNRRGLFDEIERQKIQSPYVLIIYADLDRLKYINDEYGHEEGDYAILSCARLLGETIGSSGVAGRIGGDEFAGVIYAKKPEEKEYFLKCVKEQLIRLNQISKKGYTIGMSIGIHVMTKEECKKPQDILDNLDKADILLYEEKKKKREQRER